MELIQYFEYNKQQLRIEIYGNEIIVSLLMELTKINQRKINDKTLWFQTKTSLKTFDRKYLRNNKPNGKN